MLSRMAASGKDWFNLDLKDLPGVKDAGVCLEFLSFQRASGNSPAAAEDFLCLMALGPYTT
jgi:hypothetical protein